MDRPEPSPLVIDCGKVAAQTLNLILYTGIVTNTLGLSLLIPSVRKGLRNSLKPLN